MHITRQLNPINCIKVFSFVVESCSKCISPLHYTTISIHELTILSNTSQSQKSTIKDGSKEMILHPLLNSAITNPRGACTQSKKRRRHSEQRPFLQNLLDLPEIGSKSLRDNKLQSSREEEKSCMAVLHVFESFCCL